MTDATSRDPMRIHLITLFPEFFDGPLGASVLGRAIEAGCARVERLNPRQFATNRHGTVDDHPYGGGAGMLLRPTEVAAAVRSVREADPATFVVYLTPQGRRLDQEGVRFLASLPSVTLLCGRYEGLDERAIERCVDLELSLGDFVLSGGEPAALCVIDAVARLLPGALGNAESPEEESFAAGLLEHPQFTRPPEFEGLRVPEVLLSGDHARVDAWRRKASLLRTQARRPDLWASRVGAAEDDRILSDARLEVPEWLWKARHGLERG